LTEGQLIIIGLNGLAGFNVTNVRVNVSAPAGVPNLHGFAYIPNPSVMTIAMVCRPPSWRVPTFNTNGQQGNVTLSLATAKAGIVGNSTIYDMTLKPGNNTLIMTGTLNQTLITESLNKTGFVDLIITGQSAVYNGQHLTYYVSTYHSFRALQSSNIETLLTSRNYRRKHYKATSSPSQ
jgi:hypothetical protein